MLLSLPADTLRWIFSFLPDNDIFHLLQVSKSINSLFDDVFWRFRLREHHNFDPSLQPHGQEAKLAYIDLVLSANHKWLPAVFPSCIAQIRNRTAKNMNDVGICRSECIPVGEGEEGKIHLNKRLYVFQFQLETDGAVVINFGPWFANRFKGRPTCDKPRFEEIGHDSYEVLRRRGYHLSHPHGKKGDLVIFRIRSKRRRIEGEIWRGKEEIFTGSLEFSLPAPVMVYVLIDSFGEAVSIVNRDNTY